MAHLAKYTAKDLGGLVAHYQRLKVDNTPNINPEKTKLNDVRISKVCFITDENGKNILKVQPQEHFQNILKTFEHSKRKDLKCVCDWIITLPDELVNKDISIQRKFFESCRQFLHQKYGAEAFIMASEHFDEQGKPHMHYTFIPVKTYTKDGVEHKKVCAKEVLTKKHLQSFHGELSAYVEKAMGQKLSIENGKTKDGNRTINQLKTETLRKENAKLKQELKQANYQIQFYKEGANQSMTYDEWYRKNHKAKIVPTAKQAEKALNRGSNGMSR